jgi:lantibiotic modifying enzyme
VWGLFDANEKFNLGLSHGNLAPFLFLIDAKEISAAKKMVRLFIKAFEQFGANLPGSWPHAHASEARYRSAWCYGAPMTGLALLEYSHQCNDEETAKIGTELLDTSLQEIAAHSHAHDLHFCHGLSGIIQIALRSIEYDGSRRRSKVIKLLCSEARRPISKWVATTRTSSELLEGILGPALVFSFLLTEPSQHWDQLFMTSRGR